MTDTFTVVVPAEVQSLEPYVAAGVLGATEVHLAAWVARASGVHDPLVSLAIAMAAWSSRHGHACAVLGELATAVAREQAVHPADVDTGEAVASPTITWPHPAAWLTALRTAPDTVVRVVDGWDASAVLDTRPLVLHDDRVYLQRHWVDECSVAASLRTLAVPLDGALFARAATLFDHLLPVEVDGEPNLQRRATEVALGNRLALIVGGPGTGKTYSVARLLAVLLEQAREQGQPMRVALAAPTGKAAARLQESISAALAEPEVVKHISAPVREALAGVVPTTVHRLLGPLATRRQRFRHDASNPLQHDVVVVDETSMVSLPLLARLADAIRPEARLVLIGDPDQLESVELGAVLGDLVEAASGSTGPLTKSAVRLLRGHRFGGGSPIALLADAVRRGDADQALVQLRTGAPSALIIESDNPIAPAVVAEVRSVVEPLLAEVRRAAEAGLAEEALLHSSQVRILCAHRQGRFGAAAWNQLGELWMCGPGTTVTTWYPGRPLLVSRNDPRLGLSNGDTGVVIREQDRLVAVFASGRGLLRFDPVQLEEVETAYAMTVHKSQGSEYSTVVMVLPPPSSPLAGRELVYTGFTRARQRLLVVGSEAAVRQAVSTPTRRMTGLAASLA